MVIFQNLSKNGEMLKNVGENIKKFIALIFFYIQDIKNIIFNPKFYQQFLPSLVIIKPHYSVQNKANRLNRVTIAKCELLIYCT